MKWCWLCLLCLGMGGLGCQSRSGPRSKPVTSKDVLAQVNERVVTQADYRRAMGRQSSFFRSKFLSKESRESFLHDLVRFELMVLEAERQGLAKSRAVRTKVERAMVRSFLKNTVRRLQADQVREKEVRDYYTQHASEYSSPEKRRVRQIVFRVAEQASPEQWEARRNVLMSLLPQIQANSRSSAGFVRMVKKYSEDAYSRSKGGDIGWGVPFGQGGRWEKSFSRAVFALGAIGEVSGFIRTSWGFHIVRLEGRIPAKRQSFQQARPQIVQHLLKQKRVRLVKQFLQTLRLKHRVRVNRKLLHSWRAKAKFKKPSRRIRLKTPIAQKTPQARPLRVLQTTPTSQRTPPKRVQPPARSVVSRTNRRVVPVAIRSLPSSPTPSSLPSSTPTSRPALAPTTAQPTSKDTP